MIGNNQKKNKGFTLMEIMLAAGLFIIITMAGTGIYISINAVQKANLAGQKVYTESRFLLDMIANDIQSSAIHYHAGYPGLWPVRGLELLKDDTAIQYWRDTSTGQGTLRQQIGAMPPTVLSSLSIDITDLDFYIDPEDPSATPAVPSVTIVWRAKEAGQGISNPITVNLQTTVSLRNY